MENESNFGPVAEFLNRGGYIVTDSWDSHLHDHGPLEEKCKVSPQEEAAFEQIALSMSDEELKAESFIYVQMYRTQTAEPHFLAYRHRVLLMLRAATIYLKKNRHCKT